MTNIDKETRCRKIVKELAKLDRFLEEGSIKQTGWGTKHGIFPIWFFRAYPEVQGFNSSERIAH